MGDKEWYAILRQHRQEDEEPEMYKEFLLLVDGKETGLTWTLGSFTATGWVTCEGLNEYDVIEWYDLPSILTSIAKETKDE